MKKLKKSATVQIIGGIVLLALLVVKQIVPMGSPIPLHISVAIIFVSIARPCLKNKSCTRNQVMRSYEHETI